MVVARVRALTVRVWPEWKVACGLVAGVLTAGVPARKAVRRVASGRSSGALGLEARVVVGSGGRGRRVARASRRYMLKGIGLGGSNATAFEQIGYSFADIVAKAVFGIVIWRIAHEKTMVMEQEGLLK